MSKRPVKFEIVYDNWQVYRGKTEDEFLSCPHEGIQFVIIEYEDGSATNHEELDVYYYGNASLPGSLTDIHNFNQIRSQLHKLSQIFGY